MITHVRMVTSPAAISYQDHRHTSEEASDGLLGTRVE